MKNLFLLIIFINYLFAANPNEIINRQIKDLQEKQIFEQQKSDKQINNKSFETNLLNIDEDIKEETCINISAINILDATVFKEEDFQDLIQPYLNKCNGMKNLSNLRDKISNRYIDKGYVTSRAYFKVQDLSSGKIDIFVLEGKIEDIESEDINVLNLYPNYKNKILNIKDIEVIVKQAQRLQSQNLDIQLLPASQVGYTIVEITNKSEYKPYYGNVGINNFGREKTGKYQIYNNFNYENLLGINDILSLNLNSTNRALKNNDRTLGTSINYSLPLERFLFDFFYNYSKYKQINFDEFSNDFRSNGANESFGVNSSYNLFQSLNHSFDLLLDYEKKETRNFLNDTRLDLQSYSSSSLDFGFKHSFINNSFEYYSKFLAQKGVAAEQDDIANQEKYYTKYLIDLGFTKYFDTENDLKYNLYLRGQHSKDKLSGSDELYMGGVYSVRGFEDEGLSGNRGFYVRNDVSVKYQIEDITLAPYIGLDYGYVVKDENNISGKIVGSSVGSKFYWKNFNLELFYMMPLREAKIIEDENSKFFGANLVYNY
ncbi:ShlB/FhaC/HecB family hemolysin secretion/activation protein [Aliarcobacter butzleri]|uniref:ShlB/FhaC/HecB family hemolysin secretion/activation protein n=1 Tax=Aliarcobacter butzleri TaxID=28197 RepID=UPI003AF7DE17